MSKKKILYYSDCPFFAGCENMLANFLTDDVLNDSYNIQLLYRFSNAYEEGLNKRAANVGDKTFCIKLPKQERAQNFLKKAIKPRYLRGILGLPLLATWKYYCIFFSIYPIYRKIKALGVPQILHINNGGYPAAYSCYSAVIAARLLGIKNIVYVVNNIAEGYKNPLRWLDYFLDKYIAYSVTVFITGSKFAKEQLSEVLDLGANKTANIPNGVNKRVITLQPADVKIKYNIPANRPLFSVVALLEKRKGHIVLLKAISLLKNLKSSKTDLLPIFVFEGIGAEYATLNNYISHNKLENDVILIGVADNVFNLINASDAVVLPSIANEDFPNVIIESMMLGKPVLSTFLAGIPEQVMIGKTGYLSEPNNEYQLAENITQLLDQHKREVFGTNAQHFFDENFSVRCSVDKYLKLYNNL